MGIFKTCGKLLGSVALGAAGVASAVVRTCASGAGMDALADAVGSLEDKSFNTLEDMWTPDEKKTDEYYEAQAEKSGRRAECAQRNGEAKRREIERMREKGRKD